MKTVICIALLCGYVLLLFGLYRGKNMRCDDFVKMTINEKFGLRAIYPSRILILSEDKDLAMEVSDMYATTYPEGTIIDWAEIDENQPDVVLKWIAESDMLVIIPNKLGNISEKIKYDISFARKINKNIHYYAANTNDMDEDPVIKIYRSIADQAYKEERCDVIKELKPHCSCDIKDSIMNKDEFLSFFKRLEE